MDIFRKEIREEIKDFTHITFIDQHQVKEVDPQDYSLFSDGKHGMINSHLNHKGAQIYSRYLAKRIKDDLSR